VEIAHARRNAAETDIHKKILTAGGMGQPLNPATRLSYDIFVRTLDLKAAAATGFNVD
jgi:hypothetical protein